MSTDAAVLDAPETASGLAAEAPPDTSKPSGEATPASERNGRVEPSTKEPRSSRTSTTRQPRDPATQRFAPKDGETAPAATAAAPAAPAAPAIDEGLYARAEEVGLTRYAAGKLGDKLAKEVARREAAAAKSAAPPAAAPAPVQPNTPAAPTAAAKAEQDRLAGLADLGEEYGDFSPREKAIREELLQLREKVAKQDSLEERLARFETHFQQDEQTRQHELVRKDASELDAFVAELGEEFAPIFGKGTFDSGLASAYVNSRDEVFTAARALRDVLPALQEKSFKDVAKGVAALLYPDEFNQLTERALIARAKEAAKTRGAPPASTVPLSDASYEGPLRNHPAVAAKVREVRLRRQGLAT